MASDRPAQYTTDVNLRARQRLWEHQRPQFDLVGWVLDLAGLAGASDQRVLDVGCGNGAYLRELTRRGIAVVGCDLSVGMLTAAAPHPRRVNADVVHLPFTDGMFDVVLAPHMLYHVEDRVAAAHELRRVTTRGGTCVAVTNGAGHTRALRSLVEEAVGAATPGWQMGNASMRLFSLDNGAPQLRPAFDRVERVRPTHVPPVTITDAAIAADYVASLADPYAQQTTRPWSEVVDAVRDSVQQEIDARGAFVMTGDPGAFVCT